ncbi:ribonuclease R [Rhodothalassium salexigens]|uniref:ribonuclease R n=1 Tax=Rhodothalassium salexigens TaxID=1086 RepID=UPI001911C9F5
MANNSDTPPAKPRAPRADQPDSSRAPGDPVPSKAEILAYVASADARVTKRDIARHFKVKGADKVELKARLRALKDEGALEQDPAKSLRTANALPSVTVVEITGTDVDGDPLAAPTQWDGDGAPPRIYLAPDKRRRGPALAKGDRALVRLSLNRDQRTYTARIIKVLDSQPNRVLGVFRGGDLGGRVEPIQKGAKKDFWVDRGDDGGAEDGELVLAEPAGRGHKHRPMGLKPVRVIERLGDVSGPRAISRIAIHAHALPTVFPKAAIDQAEQAQPATLGRRTDLRDVALITIDPRDARDHDDAIHAEPDTDPANPGGWVLTVAIADVGHYVRPDSALDKAARERGNSAYFPDQVVPMLPEALSTDLCSLMPGQDRACMAVRIWIDRDGHKRRHRFMRALMRSAANLTYEDAQFAADGHDDGTVGEALTETVVKPLFAAHRALARARDARQPLDLDMPEKKIELDEAGRVVAIRERERLPAHRLVEDFMVLANVCAAETLEQKRTPCMYRVHEEPSVDKLDSLREFLESLDLAFPKAQTVRPAVFNRVLDRARAAEVEHLVSEVVLRSQTQAYYSPENRGHFGLALARYAHFTSPIRRYADLLVHRGLIRALGLGGDGLTDADAEQMERIGEHISTTERRAMLAERDTVDRYLATYLAGRVGEIFAGRIAGVTRFGLFVELDETGASGLVPVGSLVGDYYVFDENARALVGRRFGHTFRLGDRADVRLVEVAPVKGGLRMELLGEPSLPAGRPGANGRPPRKAKAKPKPGGAKAKASAKGAKGGRGKPPRRKTAGKRR